MKTRAGNAMSLLGMGLGLICAAYAGTSKPGTTPTPAAVPNMSTANLNLTGESYVVSPSGTTCPKTYTFTLTLTPAAPYLAGAPYTYQFVRSNGSTGPVVSASLVGGQTLIFTDTWSGVGQPGWSLPGTWWDGIKINGGATQHLSTGNFTLSCSCPAAEVQDPSGGCIAKPSSALGGSVGTIGAGASVNSAATNGVNATGTGVLQQALNSLPGAPATGATSSNDVSSSK